MNTQTNDNLSVETNPNDLPPIPQDIETSTSDAKIKETSDNIDNTNEVMNDTTQNSTIKQPKELEINGFLNALFGLWIVYGFIASLVRFLSNLDGSYLAGGIDFVFTLVGITAIVGMYLKKRLGLILCAAYFLFQLILCVLFAQADTAYGDETIKVVMRIIMMSGFLCLRKNGHSAYYTIWNNGQEPNNHNSSENTEPPTIIPDDSTIPTSVEDTSPQATIDNSELPPIPEEPQQPIKEKTHRIKHFFGKISSSIKLSYKTIRDKREERRTSFSNNVPTQRNKKSLSQGGKITLISIVTILFILIVAFDTFLIIKVNKTDIPNYITGWTHKARYVLGMKDDTMAQEAYRLAIIAEDNEMYELAKKYLLQTYQLIDSDADLAHLYIQKVMEKKYQMYEQAYNLCSRLQYQKDADLLSIMSFLQKKKGNKEEAIRMAQEAYLMDKNNARGATITLYLIYEENGDWNNVDKWTERSLLIDNDFAQTYYVRAKALYEKKDYIGAYENYKIGYNNDKTNKNISHGRREYIDEGNAYYEIALSDFIATISANPKATDKQLFSKFPEFNNSKEMLDAAFQYANTVKHKNYDIQTLHKKFPEFFFTIDE